MAKVYIRFSKTGLGNMMLVWARGVVFARLNNLPYTTSSWWGLRWGALIRREKKNRLYRGYFIETVLWKQWAIKLNCTLATIEKEPVVDIISGLNNNEKKIYLFNKVITDPDIFGAFRNHHAIITEELNKALTPKMKIKLAGYKVPEIGVHIRRGDFKLGNQTTPLEYFIKGITVIRSIIGKNLPVTIFTDADEQELTELLALPNTSIAEDKPDILDILLLSKSKVMILSKSSTFGYWAAFLSDAIVIRPVNDWQKIIKYSNADGIYTEVKWNFDDAFSTQQLTEKISTIQL